MRRIGILSAVFLVLLALAIVPVHAQRVPSEEPETALLPKPPSPFPVSPIYLGDFCWKASKTENTNGPLVPPETFTIRLSLTSVGGGSYLAQGVVVVANLPTAQAPIMSGGGVAAGTDLLLTLTISHDHSPDPWRDAGALHIRLTTTTWAGTFWSVNSTFNIVTRAFSHFWSKGTLTPIACP
jgi:hypothetical protein